MSRWIVTALIALTLSPFAQAGPESSGGGGVVICRTANHAIRSAQLMDLYEGQILFGYKPHRVAGAPLAQLRAALDRFPLTPDLKTVGLLGDDGKTYLEQASRRILDSIKFLPAGVEIAGPTDLGTSHAIVMPEGCEIAAAAYYEADGHLRVSKDIYDHMSTTDRAALIIHEATYKIVRDITQATTSEDVRPFVAALFAAPAAQPEILKRWLNLFTDRSPWSDGAVDPHVRGIRLEQPPSAITLAFTAATPGEFIFDYRIGYEASRADVDETPVRIPIDLGSADVIRVGLSQEKDNSPHDGTLTIFDGAKQVGLVQLENMDIPGHWDEAQDSTAVPILRPYLKVPSGSSAQGRTSLLP